MAKETKAQRIERERSERAAYEAAYAETYPQRLLDLLERATAENFEMYVHGGKFHVSNLDDRDEHYELGFNVGKFDQDSETELNQLECAVEYKENVRREADRKFILRQSALSKLTDEERAALNL